MYKIHEQGKGVAILLIVVLLATFTTAKPEKKPNENSKVIPIPTGSFGEADAIPEMTVLYNSTLDATVLATAVCSGTINLPAVGGSVSVDYKYSIGYDNNERCVWLVNNTIGSSRATLKLAWTLTANGFESGYDFLKVLSWNRTLGMSSTTLAANTRTELSAEAMFLSFSSDASNVGTGFLIRIDVISAETPANFTATNYVYYSTAYSVSHVPYKNNDVTSTLVVRKSNVTDPFLFSVDYLFSEVHSSGSCTYDPLDVYEVLRTGIERRSRLCGNFTTSPVSSRTTDPVIALFGSDYSNVGEGFKLSWSN